MLYDSPMKVDSPEFWARVDATGDCWVWTGARSIDGYGMVKAASGTRYVHRLVYEHLVGPIEPDLVLDHLCRNPPCVNPDHLEAVDNETNIKRGAPRGRWAARFQTHCLRGHAYTDENTYRRADGTRECRRCRHELRMAAKRSRRAA